MKRCSRAAWLLLASLFAACGDNARAGLSREEFIAVNVELREAGPDSVEAVLARNDVTAKELRAFVLSRTTSELASVWREIARHTAPEAEARPQLPAPARGPDTATSEEEPGDTARDKDPRLRPPPAVPDPVLPPAEIEPG